MKERFHGWWITVGAAITFGIAVGLPYYNISFFYDYFQRTSGWTRGQITLGFPLAALLTIWFGPVALHRFSPRKLIVVGTGLTAVALFGFGLMSASLSLYYTLWVIYMLGYTCSGPVPHQLLISYWFRRNRGKAMGIVFAGIALFGSLGSFLVTWLTRTWDVRTALCALAVLMLLAWPVTALLLRNKPSDVGQNVDGDRCPAVPALCGTISLRNLLTSSPFWALLAGSTFSIGAIGAVNFHMKFVFLEGGFEQGVPVDTAWRTASILILWSSIAGRLLMGALADHFSKKAVMAMDYLIVSGTIPLLLLVKPGDHVSLPLFAILFGFGMGADYMLIPLVAAEQFGVNNLARVMGIVIPLTIIGQSWFPYLVSILRESSSTYWAPMSIVLTISLIGAVAIMLLPRSETFGRAVTDVAPASTVLS